MSGYALIAANASSRRPECLSSPADKGEEQDREGDRGKDQTLLERPSPRANNVRTCRRALPRRRVGNKCDVGHRLFFRVGRSSSLRRRGVLGLARRRRERRLLKLAGPLKLAQPASSETRRKLDRLRADKRMTDVELNLRVGEKRNVAWIAEVVAAVEESGHVTPRWADPAGP